MQVLEQKKHNKGGNPLFWIAAFEEELAKWLIYLTRTPDAL